MISKIGIGFLSMVFAFTTANAELKAPALSGDLQCVITPVDINGKPTGESAFDMDVQLTDGVGMLTVNLNGQVLTAFSVTGVMGSRSGYGITFDVPEINFLKNPNIDVQNEFVAMAWSAELIKDTFVFNSTSQALSIHVRDHGQKVSVFGNTTCNGKLRF